MNEDAPRLPALPTLNTERLTLTIGGPEDATGMVRFLRENRAHLAPWDPPHPEGFETLEFWLRQMALSRRDFTEGRSARFIIRARGGDPRGPILGRCNFSNVIRGPLGTCFLGYSLDHRVEGRGYMTEALGAAIDYAFEGFKLHRIQANYIPTNERSGRVLRRLGFTIEGYARDYLFIDGAWRDHILTALVHPGGLDAPPTWP